MKTLLKIGAVVVVLFVIAVIVVVVSLDKMIKAGVETVGPEITGTSVKLEGVDLKSALSDKLVIEQILIDGPEITYESGPSGSNVGKIQENVAASSKSVAPKGAAESKSQKKDQTQKKIQINDFIFRNGKVTMSASMLTGKPITISLPDIHLKDIGKNSGGVTAETAAAEVFKAIEKSVAQSASKAAGEAAKGMGSEAGKSGSKALEGVKGLFGK